MNVELKSSPTDIRLKFRKLNTFDDIAHLLEIPVQFLWKILVRDKLVNYRTFKLRKKNGDERTIYSPLSNLAILQKKLSYILSLNFTHHDRSHGFIENRSIVTNASEHLRKKYVLNLDLENFFESISFRRIRHMFISYYKFNDKVASTLANICSHPDGFLPQGAPTSPVVSNIIAKTLDKELKRVAIGAKWTQYTRYADDITFSTSKEQFPKEIATINESGIITLNENIIKIIEKNGFKVNDKKTRLQNHKQSQSVTGITVNEKLNIDRRYIRRIRSILSCIEKNINNLDEAHKIFEMKYPFRQRKRGSNPDMFLILRGMISHVGNVKGKQDSVYWKLANRFNKVTPHEPIKLQLSRREFHEDNTYVIDSDYTAKYYNHNENIFDEALYGQGTGFILRTIGLVTNAHVIEGIIEGLEQKFIFSKKYYIEAYKSTLYSFPENAKVLCYDIEKDIAILSVEGLEIHEKGYMYNESIKEEQQIELVGFPGYRKGQDIKIQKGFVQGVRMHLSKDGTKRYKRREISATIYGGNSGGPIVNTDNEVIGLAVKGATMNGVSPNEIVPISEVIELAKKHGIINEHVSISF
ncbi:reverse transcriptase domain-containing protein [Paenibacillus sp. S150]|uniref:reverse transcriptase domain-containing protein n=1 Tax=Paenibacillus sp. S150 TaxID=2749826 RepID=UPI00281563DD|nr:reverse transcriptase domain-containing protein [Paenibacillus sp. S150]